MIWRNQSTSSRVNRGQTLSQGSGTGTAALLAFDLIRAGETPVLEIVTPPAHGTLTQNPDGTLSYTPAANCT